MERIWREAWWSGQDIGSRESTINYKGQTCNGIFNSNILQAGQPKHSHQEITWDGLQRCWKCNWNFCHEYHKNYYCSATGWHYRYLKADLCKIHLEEKILWTKLKHLVVLGKKMTVNYFWTVLWQNLYFTFLDTTSKFVSSFICL